MFMNTKSHQKLQQMETVDTFNCVVSFWIAFHTRNLTYHFQNAYWIPVSVDGECLQCVQWVKRCMKTLLHENTFGLLWVLISFFYLENCKIIHRKAYYRGSYLVRSLMKSLSKRSENRQLPVRGIWNKTGTSQVGAIFRAPRKWKWGPFGDKKSRKTRTVPRNIERWDPLVPSGSVGYV